MFGVCAQSRGRRQELCLCRWVKRRNKLLSPWSSACNMRRCSGSMMGHQEQQIRDELNKNTNESGQMQHVLKHLSPKLKDREEWHNGGGQEVKAESAESVSNVPERQKQHPSPPCISSTIVRGNQLPRRLTSKNISPQGKGAIRNKQRHPVRRFPSERPGDTSVVPDGSYQTVGRSPGFSSEGSGGLERCMSL